MFCEASVAAAAVNGLRLPVGPTRGSSPGTGGGPNFTSGFWTSDRARHDRQHASNRHSSAYVIQDQGRDDEGNREQQRQQKSRSKREATAGDL